MSSITSWASTSDYIADPIALFIVKILRAAYIYSDHSRPGLPGSIPILLLWEAGQSPVDSCMA